MKHFNRALIIILVIAAAPALGAVPTTLVSWDTINSPAPSNSTQHHGWAIDGTTSYHQLGTSGGSRIIKVTGLDTGTPTAVELVSNAAWAAASGSSGLTAINSFSVSGGYLQFTDTSSDAVWRVERNTGAVTPYVSKAQIQTFTGGTNVQLVSPSKVMPNGEHAFYEGQTDAILATAGAGNLVTLVSNADLQGLQGNTDVSGGIGFDSFGTMYWGNNVQDALYKRTEEGALSVALTAVSITAVTGQATVGFGDIEGGPDGWVYFRDTVSRGILKFEPSDPAGTLAFALTETELLSGPAASSNVFELGFYSGQLAFNIGGTNGLYLIPEPASVALLALGMLALRRRR